MKASEDPTRPDVIHHRIVRADEFVREEFRGGFQRTAVMLSYHRWFLFAYWNDEIRPRIGQHQGIEDNEVRV